jgi:hypothetical protein
VRHRRVVPKGHDGPMTRLPPQVLAQLGRRTVEPQPNQNPHVFVWTASVERILAKIAKCEETFDALHWRAVAGAHIKRACQATASKRAGALDRKPRG